MKRIIPLLLLLISIQGFSQTQDNRTPVNVITPYIPPAGFNLDSVRLLGSMWTGASWATRTFYGADIIRYDLKKADTAWVATHAWAQNSFPAIQRFLDSLSALRAAVGSAINAGNASSVPWSGITGTPNTLQAYGLSGDAYTKGQIDATFAPIFSPALAGTPTGPTAVAGSSNNQLATTAFVQNAVAASSSGVSSFIGRSGAVSAQSGDYSSFYPILSGSYANPTWITSLAWSKITGATGLDSTNAPALHSQAYYDVRYRVPIDANTTSIASNTASINIINSYYTAGVLKPANLPGATASTLGGIKVGSGLAIDVNSVLSATGGTVYTINNVQRAVFPYIGSNVFALPQNASKVTGMTVYDTIQGNIIQVPIANYTFNGANQVTFVQGAGSGLQGGDKVWIDYDIGSAFGVIDSIAAPMLHSEAYYNTKYAKSITFTTTGTSGAATWNPATGALNIPQYSNGGGGMTNPMTAIGSLIYGGTAGAATELLGNSTTAKQVLLSTGSGSAANAPAWGTLAKADVGLANVQNLDQTNASNISSGTLPDAQLSSNVNLLNSVQTITGAKTVNETTAAGSGSLAGSAFTLNQTWATTGNPTLFKINATKTTTGGSANLLDVQLGGVSKFSINEFGLVTTNTITMSGTLTSTGTQTLLGNGSLFNDVAYFSQSAQAVTTAQWLPTAAATVYVHRGYRSSTAAANLSAGADYAGTVFGQEAVTIPTGTSNLAAAAAFLSPAITATGTLTEAANVFIKDAPTGGTLNYALHVAAGVSKFDGGVGFGRTTVADAAYTITAADRLVVYTSLTATRAVTLPSAASVKGQEFIIKDEAGTATANNITIVGTVDGVTNPTAVNTNFKSYTIYSNGTAFFTR